MQQYSNLQSHVTKIDTTIHRENFIVKKVTWNKSSVHFNFVKTGSIVCTSTKELR